MNTMISNYNFKPGFKYEIEVIDLESLFEEHFAILSNPHRANFYHIFYFEKAPKEHMVDFKLVDSHDKTFVFVDSEQVQYFKGISNVKGKLILFTEAFFSETEEDSYFLKNSRLFDSFLATTVLDAGDRLNVALAAIDDELKAPEDHYSYNLLHNLLHNLLLYAERERQRKGSSYIKKGADYDYTTLFKDLLYKDFRRVKTVGAFAKMINITEKRLTQATMSTLGKTPKQIIDEKIILEAKRLSIYTSNTIKEISYQLGFEETSNFIKYFKKHVDMTPIEFRESYNL